MSFLIIDIDHKATKFAFMDIPSTVGLMQFNFCSCKHILAVTARQFVFFHLLE